jgi:hypothetical protein
MATILPLKVVTGTVSQLAAGDELSVIGVDARVAGALTLGSTIATSVVVGGTGATSAVTQVDIGVADATTTINVGGTNTTSIDLVTSAGGTPIINIGGTNTQVNIPGNLTVTSTAEFDGNTIIGASLTLDTLSVVAGILGDLTFREAANHNIRLEGATVLNASASTLSVTGGAADGSGAGGLLSLTGGAAPGVGIGGDVTLTGGSSVGGAPGGVKVISPRAITQGAALSLTQNSVTAGFFVGSAVPSAGAGVTAPLGSLYQQDAGVLYLKTGASPTTGWDKVEVGTGGSASLQTAYVNGQTIAVTTVPVGISSAVAAVDALSVLTTGTGTALTVNTTTSTGDALQVQVGNTPVITVDSTGAVTVLGKNDGVFGSGVTISAGAGAAATGAGGGVSINAGAGHATGPGAGGGLVEIVAGEASTADNGGPVNIRAGDNSFAGAGEPGSISITAGSKTSALGTATASGYVQIAAGDNAGDGIAADVSINGGSSTGLLATNHGGDVRLTGGDSDSGTPGGVVINSGRSADATSPTAGPALTITQTGASGATASIFAGSLVPSALGVAASEGSLYLRDAGATGELYIKTANLDTDWTLASVAGDTDLQTAYTSGAGTIAVTAAKPVSISSAVASTALLVNTTSSGNALQVQVATSDVVVVDQTGAVLVTATSNAAVGSAVSLTAGSGGASGGGGDATLKSGAATKAFNAGTVSVLGGDNIFSGAGLGGLVDIKGGAKIDVAATAAAGGVNITGGANSGTNFAAAGGSVTIAGGAVAGTNATPGNVSISGGQAAGAGQGAQVSVVAGENTTGVGGTSLVRGGNAISGAGGTVKLWGGSSASGLPGATLILSDRSATNTIATEDGAALTIQQTGAAGTTVELFAGTADPSDVGASGVVADLGSLYLRNVGAATGEMYLKTATGDKAWSQIATLAGQSLQAAYDAGAVVALDDTGGIQFNQADGALTNAATLSLTNAEDGANFNTLTVNRSPVTSAAAGDGVGITMGANALGAGLGVTQGGTGTGIVVNATSTGAIASFQSGATPVLAIGATGGFASTPLVNQVFTVTTTGTGGISLDSVASSYLKVSGGALTLQGATTSAFGVTAAPSAVQITTGGDVSLTAASTKTITLAASGAASYVAIQSATGQATIDAGSYISLTAGSGVVQLGNTAKSDAIVVQAAGGVTVAPKSGQDFSATTAGAGVVTLNAAAASNFTVTGANLTLSTATSGNVVLLAPSVGDITFKANASLVIPFNTAAAPDLVGFTATSIIGALNELAVGTTSASQIVQGGFDTATNSVTVGMLGYLTSAANVVQRAIATSMVASRVFGASEGTANSMTTAGTIELQTIETGVTVLAGEPLFLSAVLAGSVTNAAPSAPTEVILPVGYARTNGTAAGGTVPMILGVGLAVLLT